MGMNGIESKLKAAGFIKLTKGNETSYDVFLYKGTVPVCYMNYYSYNGTASLYIMSKGLNNRPKEWEEFLKAYPRAYNLIGVGYEWLMRCHWEAFLDTCEAYYMAICKVHPEWVGKGGEA